MESYDDGLTGGGRGLRNTLSIRDTLLRTDTDLANLIN